MDFQGRTSIVTGASQGIGKAIALELSREGVEVILVDREQVSKYKGMEWLAKGKHKGRVFRGKSSSGKRSRGILTHKGKGAEKLRPSLRAKKRLAK